VLLSFCKCTWTDFAGADLLMDFAEAACGLQVQFVLHAECSSDAICCSRITVMSLPALLPSTVNLPVVLLLHVVLLHGLCCCGV